MTTPPFTAEKAAEIRKRFAAGISRVQLAKEFELSQTVIGQILRNEAVGNDSQSEGLRTARVHNRTNPSGPKHAPRKNWY
ncbi:hypothetical protein OIU93_19595 [Paeniglutamicibacter sp. ZC-3]|uniref:hypothetical protein n=1 Tax=Paeniglutamicibacter sp. ZC-3 TaxID=2986919 RepID=UPI0021F6BF34|nr:hypothetical protein [Paeniglutamicibacter sp. ZC-3]MCV9996474.1 hypothetical protein [Paeniglutamicibacter sp. ZC-3]